jgi:hypothetical protein
MGSYMNRGGGSGQGPPGGPPGPPSGPHFDLGNKLSGLNLDHSMKMMSRQSGQGDANYRMYFVLKACYLW